MKNIISNFLSQLKPNTDNVEIETPQANVAEFKLLYKNILIGKLDYDDGIWKFNYSKIFKEQIQINPISDFPDKNKEYRQTDLWPFFSSRIPTKNQPMVLEAIQNKSIISFDEVSMLKNFGKRTITNPFILEMAI